MLLRVISHNGFRYPELPKIAPCYRTFTPVLPRPSKPGVLSKSMRVRHVSAIPFGLVYPLGSTRTVARYARSQFRTELRIRSHVPIQGLSGVYGVYTGDM